jgi:hypothetical protein
MHEFKFYKCKVHPRANLTTRTCPLCKKERSKIYSDSIRRINKKKDSYLGLIDNLLLKDSVYYRIGSRFYDMNIGTIRYCFKLFTQIENMEVSNKLRYLTKNNIQLKHQYEMDNHNINVILIGTPSAELFSISPGLASYEELVELEDVKTPLSLKEKEDHTNVCRIISLPKNTICAICYENIKKYEVVRSLWCNHLFHQNCIDHWFKINKKCPMCRSEYIK